MKEKEYLFSNLKAFLIVTVVLGHFVQLMPAEPVKNFVMLLIYSFHMPAFLFISGYFSKNAERSHKKAFESYFLGFVYMSFVYFVIRLLVTGDVTFRFIVPVFAAWYLLVLFYYKWSLKYLIRIKGIFYISVVIALLAGLVPFIGDYFSAGRFFAYLPVFLLGFFCTKEHIQQLRRIPKWAALVLLAVIMLLFGWYVREYDFTYNVFLNSAPYSHYGMNWWQGMLFRGYSQVMAMVLLGCFLILFPAKKHIYSGIGDRTLSVYALHCGVYLLVNRLGILEGENVLMNFAVAAALTMLVVGVLSLPQVYRIYMLGMNAIVRLENRLLYGKQGHVSKELPEQNQVMENEGEPIKNGMSRKVWRLAGGAVLFVAVCALVLCIGTGVIGGGKAVQTDKNYITVSDSNRYIMPIAEEITAKTDIVYTTVKNSKNELEELKLDMYEAAGDTQKNRPAIVFIHGGGLTSGDKATNDFEKELAMEFAKKGYVTLDVNYRLRESLDSSNTAAALSDAAQDVAAVVQWIQDRGEQFGIDRNRIALAGHSSGAVIAVNLTYSNTSVNEFDRTKLLGVVDLSGGMLYSGTPQSVNPPCLIMHGTIDTTADYKESEQLAKLLTNKQIETVFYPLQGTPHDLRGKINEVESQITKFLYRQLTGVDVSDEVLAAALPEFSYEYRKAQEREQKGPVYEVKQLQVQLDGDLQEWNGFEKISLVQLKDAGTSLPATDDFTGNIMVGWNETTPSTIYLAATITDNFIQNFNAPDGKWYLDDCLELVFDLSQNSVDEQLAKWVVGADGKDLSVLAAADNTKVKVVSNGNTYTYELAIDLSRVAEGAYKVQENSALYEGRVIGFSAAYNDGEDNVRKYQIGWTAGKSSDRTTLGNLKFVK